METEARFDVVHSASETPAPANLQDEGPLRPLLFHGSVLRVLLRLARRQMVADVKQILVRTGGNLIALRPALAALENEGLIERIGEDSARLTMPGFAVAVALAASRRKKERTVVRLPKRIVRKRAA